jgi:glycosyltransferase involved in cell wall biosynthesis
MKIIYHSGRAWQLYSIRLPLMRAMKDRGVEVLACGPEDEFRPMIEAHGVGFRNVRTNLHGTNPFKELRIVASLWRLYRHERPTAVHHFALKPAIYGSIAARLAGVPVIVNTVTGLGYAFRADGLLQRIVRLLWRFSCKQRTWTIFQNPDNFNKFRELGLVDMSRAAIIRGSGVDCQRFSPAEMVPFRESAPTEVRFLMFTRLLRDKGVLEYIEAARLVRRRLAAAAPRVKATFVLMGGAPPTNPTGVPKELLTNPTTIAPEVIDEHARSGVIEYHPHDDNVRPHILSSDVVVLPSYGEGLPRSLLEAMACGKPIITTRAPGCREVVRHLENGLLVEPRDSAGLARAFEYMLAHASDLKRMGEASRRMVLESFSDEVVIAQTLQNYARAGFAV